VRCKSAVIPIRIALTPTYAVTTLLMKEKDRGCLLAIIISTPNDAGQQNREAWELCVIMILR